MQICRFHPHKMVLERRAKNGMATCQQISHTFLRTPSHALLQTQSALSFGVVLAFHRLASGYTQRLLRTYRDKSCFPVITRAEASADVVPQGTLVPSLGGGGRKAEGQRGGRSTGLLFHVLSLPDGEPAQGRYPPPRIAVNETSNQTALDDPLRSRRTPYGFSEAPTSGPGPSCWIN